MQSKRKPRPGSIAGRPAYTAADFVKPGHGMTIDGMMFVIIRISGRRVFLNALRGTPDLGLSYVGRTFQLQGATWRIEKVRRRRVVVRYIPRGTP